MPPTKLEKNLSNEFLKKGYIIRPVKDKKKLKDIADLLKYYAFKKIKKKIANQKNFFNETHKFIPIEKLNDFRLDLYNKVNKNKIFKKNYFELAKPYLEHLVGNELAMQKRINLSIQFPDDDSSLLPLHSDTWSGDSPFEIVHWLPLVDCYKTKSMYILKPSKLKNFYKKFSLKGNKNSDFLFRNIKKDLSWINIKYGEVLIFNQSLPHGNVINNEFETRWSMNCRFKSLFSPYGNKRLGEFFEPLLLKTMTKIGLEYTGPE